MAQKEKNGCVMTPVKANPMTEQMALATGNVGASVHLDSLVRKYGRVHVLDGLCLGIEPGELMALLGPSGGLRTPRRGDSYGDVTLEMEIR